MVATLLGRPFPCLSSSGFWYLVSGGFDYMVKFFVRSVTHYQEVIEAILEKNIGVSKYFSYIVIKSPIVKSHASVKMLSTSSTGR